MSSAFPTDFLGRRSGRERLFFWIPPTDDTGFAADTIFVEAAYSKAQQLRLYRSKDLTDGAVRANLVERAVYAASRARTGDSVQDPNGYLYATFTRLVDRHISDEDVLVGTSPSELDVFSQGTAPTECPNTNDLDDAIFRDQILNAMSPEDRWAWERRLNGYDVQEIASRLNVSADCLSTRMRRCAKDVARILRLERARE